jgi:uncharacterized protein with GYD domain
MSRYLFIARYASEGAKGVLTKGGTARRSAIEKSVTDLGGHVETFDFAFGEDDVYTIIDLPDPRAAAAMAMNVNASGTTHVRTIVLLTPEEIDAAANQSVAYTAPGS